MKLNSRIRILSAFLAMTLFLTACGSGEGTPNNKVDSTENNQVTVEKEDNDVVTNPSDDTEVNGVVEDVEKEPTEEVTLYLGVLGRVRFLRNWFTQLWDLQI